MDANTDNDLHDQLVKAVVAEDLEKINSLIMLRNLALENDPNFIDGGMRALRDIKFNFISAPVKKQFTEKLLAAPEIGEQYQQDYEAHKEQKKLHPDIAVPVLFREIKVQEDAKPQTKAGAMAPYKAKNTLE